MSCTCRVLPHCPSCNASVRLPYSNLQGGFTLASFLRRSARNERSTTRENLNRLAEGHAPCPSCGETVEAMHDRRCVREALGAAGFSPSDREKLLARMSFPE